MKRGHIIWALMLPVCLSYSFGAFKCALAFTVGVCLHHHLCAGVDADIIIYVTTSDPDTCGDTLASAAACAFDAGTNRPVAGNIIFCKFSPNQYDKDLATAVHEIFHILVCTHLAAVDRALADRLRCFQCWCRSDA